MGRAKRIDAGGYVYHVINRANGRMTMFEDDADYAAFERIVWQAQQRTGMRILNWCLMPNHWHLVVWPKDDGQLSRFVGWLTLTHTQRWHAHRHTTGEGHLYQGRYKSFIVQTDSYLWAVCRYVERNALRAKMVKRAEDWRWGSLWRWVNRRKAREEVPELSDGPLERPRNWVERVNRAESEAELEALRASVNRGRPYGAEDWVKRTVTKLDLQTTLRPRGRPKIAKTKTNIKGS
ncbi:MAG: transposase [Phycisphaeraceae bacterium]